MTKSIRILNWNTQIANPRARSNRFEAVKQRIDQWNADVICLTEAYPQTLPKQGETITSGLSGWGDHEGYGARKVLLWNKFGWQDVDPVGSYKLPEGRFISGITRIQELNLRVVGMCIPYHGYRNHAKWGDKQKSRWQGACEYLEALRHDVLVHKPYATHSILLGDFNLQIPAKNYPYPSENVNALREETFKGWFISTAGEIDDPVLDKRFIDHVALTPDFEVKSRIFISRFDEAGGTLSDHNGVCIDIEW